MENPPILAPPLLNIPNQDNSELIVTSKKLTENKEFQKLTLITELETLLPLKPSN